VSGSGLPLCTSVPPIARPSTRVAKRQHEDMLVPDDEVGHIREPCEQKPADDLAAGTRDHVVGLAAIAFRTRSASASRSSPRPSRSCSYQSAAAVSSASASSRTTTLICGSCGDDWRADPEQRPRARPSPCRGRRPADVARLRRARQPPRPRPLVRRGLRSSSSRRPLAPPAEVAGPRQARHFWTTCRDYSRIGAHGHARRPGRAAWVPTASTRIAMNGLRCPFNQRPWLCRRRTCTRCRDVSGEIINVGSGTGTPMNRLVDTLLSSSGRALSRLVEPSGWTAGGSRAAMLGTRGGC
jgi:hypothetical protein